MSELFKTIFGNGLSIAKSSLTGVTGLVSGKYTAGIITAILLVLALWYGYHKVTTEYYNEGVTAAEETFKVAQDKLDAELKAKQAQADSDRAKLNADLQVAKTAKDVADADAKAKEATMQGLLEDYVSKNKDTDAQNEQLVVQKEQLVKQAEKVTSALQQTQKSLTEAKANVQTTKTINHSLCFGANDDGLRLINDSIPSIKSK